MRFQEFLSFILREKYRAHPASFTSFQLQHFSGAEINSLRPIGLRGRCLQPISPLSQKIKAEYSQYLINFFEVLIDFSGLLFRHQPLLQLSAVLQSVEIRHRDRQFFQPYVYIVQMDGLYATHRLEFLRTLTIRITECNRQFFPLFQQRDVSVKFGVLGHLGQVRCSHRLLAHENGQRDQFFHIHIYN